MEKQDQLIAMMKLREWEAAKGHLRALMMMQLETAGLDVPQGESKWEALDALIDQFVKEVQESDLHC